MPHIPYGRSDLRYGWIPSRLVISLGRVEHFRFKPSSEDLMAATRKSAKRTARKKRARSKPASARKRSGRKSAAKRGSKTRKTRVRKTTTLKRKAKKGLRAAREGLDTVRQAGEKTWSALRSTTSQVVEGVRDRLSQNPDTETNYR